MNTSSDLNNSIDTAEEKKGENSVDNAQSNTQDANIQQNSQRKKKKRIKTVVGICIGALILIVGFLAYFFLLTSESIALSNTLKSYDMDFSMLTDIFDKYSQEGVEGTVGSQIDLSSTKLTLETSFNNSPDVGHLNFKVNTNDDEGYDLNLYYDEDTVALSGLSQNPDDYLYIPLKDFKAQLDKSIFHPDSGSKYALSTENYDILVSCFSESEDDAELYEKTQDAIEELNRILAHCAEITVDDTSYGWNLQTFSFTKTVVAKLSRDNIEEITDYLTTEIKNNKKLEILFDEENGITEKEQLLEALDDIPSSMKNLSAEISYTVYGGKIRNIKIVTENKIESISTKNQYNFDFTYTKHNPKITGKLETTTEGISEVIKSISSVTDIELALKQNKGQNVYDLKTSGTDTVTMEKEKTITDKEPCYFRILHNTENGKIFFLGGADEERKDLYIQGYFTVNEKTGSFKFSIDKVSFDSIDLDGSVFYMDLSFPKSKPEKKNVKQISLLEMSEDDLWNFFLNIPLTPLDNILKDLTGAESLFTYSSDNKPIFDNMALLLAVDSYTNAFNQYLENSDDIDNISGPLSFDNYIYNEELDLYIVMEYNVSNHNLTFDAYYELPQEILDSHHKAYIDTQTSKLVVHDLDVLEHVPPSCLASGYGKYRCKICDRTYYQDFPKWEHKEENLQIKFMGLDSVEHSGQLQRCKTCLECYYFKGVFNYCGFKLIKTEDGYHLRNYSVYDTQFFHVPSEILEYLTITNITTNAAEFVTIVVPEGMKTIAAKSFSGSGNLKILVLPSSVTEIADSAFSENSSLKRIYYAGTEEQWNTINLNNYREKWKDVEVVFTADIPDKNEIDSVLKA